MARKAAAPKAASVSPAPKKTARRKPAAKRAAPSAAAPGAFMPDPTKQLAEMSRMANLLTPDQAIEFYKANAKMALDVINAAIDSTAKLRKLQFHGEETAREFQKRAAKDASEVKDAQALMAMSQDVGREAIEKSVAYWSEMFGLIVEIQQRLTTLMREQASSMPGYRQAKAAMGAMPDLGPMKNVVDAMQGLIGSGGGAFAQMQKLMSDMTRMAQNAVPGFKR